MLKEAQTKNEILQKKTEYLYFTFYFFWKKIFIDIFFLRNKLSNSGQTVDSYINAEVDKQIQNLLEERKNNLVDDEFMPYEDDFDENDSLAAEFSRIEPIEQKVETPAPLPPPVIPTVNVGCQVDLEIDTHASLYALGQISDDEEDEDFKSDEPDEISSPIVEEPKEEIIEEIIEEPKEEIIVEEPKEEIIVEEPIEEIKEEIIQSIEDPKLEIEEEETQETTIGDEPLVISQEDDYKEEIVEQAKPKEEDSIVEEKEIILLESKDDGPSQLEWQMKEKEWLQKEQELLKKEQDLLAQLDKSDKELDDKKHKIKQQIKETRVLRGTIKQLSSVHEKYKEQIKKLEEKIGHIHSKYRTMIDEFERKIEMQKEKEVTVLEQLFRLRERFSYAQKVVKSPTMKTVLKVSFNSFLYFVF